MPSLVFWGSPVTADIFCPVTGTAGLASLFDGFFHTARECIGLWSFVPSVQCRGTVSCELD